MSRPDPDNGATLYVGTVRHTRLRPRNHDFRYRVFYALFDIDRIDELDRATALFSADRFNLFGFRHTDHGALDGRPLRPWAVQTFAGAGVDLEGGRVLLLALPRMLGFAFNPISVWYGFGPSGDLRGVIHEVRNTFGDRHIYVAALAGPDLSHSGAKQLHVSPFNDMNQTYHFTITEPGSRVALGIRSDDDRGVLFRAGLQLAAVPFTDANLARVFVTHPLLTIRVVAAIHWQAAKLWLKRVPFHSRPGPSRQPITVLRKATT